MSPPPPPRAGGEAHRVTQGLVPEVPRVAAVRAALLSAALFCVIAAFHAALVLGARWGEFTQGGGTSGSLTATGRIVAAVSCALSLIMAMAILGRVGRGPLRRRSSRLKTALAWFTTVYAALAVVLNLITRSTSERNLWAPVSILLLALVTFVMTTTHQGNVERGE